MCIASCFLNIYLMSTASFIVNFFRVFNILRTHTYVNKQVCRWYIILTFFRLSLTISMIIFFQNESNLNITALLVITLFPFCYQIGNLTVLKWYTFINLDCTDQSAEGISSFLFKYLLGESDRKIDIFCRQLMESTRERIKLSSDFKNSEIIFAQHVPYLKTSVEHKKEIVKLRILIKPNYYFYYQNQKYKQVTQNILDEYNVQQDQLSNQDDAIYFQTIQTIQVIYEEAIKNKFKKNALQESDFSYLTFLSTVHRNQCLAYFKILNTKSKKNLVQGIKDQQKLQNVISLLEIQCKNQQNGKLAENKNEFQLYKILQFEEELKIIQQLYCECLTLYKAIAEKLLLSFIEINEIFSQIKQFRDKRNKVESKILHQLKDNYNSENLKNICLNFDFYILHKSNLMMFYEKLSRQLSKKYTNKEVYEESSCFLFISLLDQSFGTIKSLNNSFVQTLGFSSKQQVINKSVLHFQLLPVSSSHGRQLQNFLINELTSPIYNQIEEISLLLARHQNGYCVPFHITIQTQQVDLQDFGITVWAKPIKGDSLYLVLDNKNPNKIKQANKQFYKRFLNQKDDYQQLITIQADNLIPIIDYLIQKSRNQKILKFQTVLISPNSGFYFNKSSLNDPNFLNYLKNTDIFSVNVSFQLFNQLDQFEPDIYLIIDNLYPQNDSRDKIQLLQFYQQQIKETCQINLELDLEMQEKDLNSQISFKQNQFDFINQGRSSIQFVKNVSLQNEQQSTITQIPNTATTNSIYKSNSQIKQSQNRQQQKIKKDIAHIQMNFSPRQNYQYMLSSPVASQIQQLINQVNETTDLIYKQQSDQQQNMIEDQEAFAKQNNHDPNTKQLSPQTNQLDVFNFSQDINALEFHQDNENTNRQSIKNNQNSFIFKQGNDFPPLSSKRGLIQQQIIPKIQKYKHKTELSKNHEKQFKKYDFSDKSFQDKEKNKVKQNLDIESISSSSRSLQSKYVFENINKNKKLRYLKIINALGILSIIAILTLNLFGFFTLLTSLISQRENFKYINWIYMINIQISYSLSERNIILLNKFNHLSTPAAQYETFMDLLKEQNFSRIKLSKEHMRLLYNNTNQDIEVFKIIQNVQIPQNIYSCKNTFQKQNLSMVYSILLQIFGIYYFVSDLDSQDIIKKQNEMNYPALNEQVQTVFSQMNENYLNQLDQIETQSLIQLFMITLIMLAFLISIIPSYIFAKKKQQKILKLFATFHCQSLKEIISQITNQLQYFQIDQKSGSSKYNFSNFSVQNNQNHTNTSVSEKKLNISQTSRLQYSLKNLVAALFVIFCLTTIYPLYNYLSVKQFIENSRVIYDFNNAVCISYFEVLNSLRARQGLAMAFLMPEQQSISISTYQSLLNQLTVQINQLPNLIKQNLEKVNEKNLHNQEVFDDFLVNLFTQNACETLKKYTQYQNGDFLHDQCTTVGKGSLQSGLLNGIMFFFSIYKDYLSFAFSPNATIYEQNFNKYNKNVLAVKQFQFKVEISKEFEYLLNFFQEQNLELYDNYEKLTIILVIVQICFVVIIFAVSWSYYFKKINNQIFSTKQLLNIFPSQYLIQNSYIMSFLNLHD